MNDQPNLSYPNASLDASRADILKGQAVAALNTRLRKTAWGTTLYLMACVAVFLYGWHGFQGAETTRDFVGAAILMLIAYESTVLIKLWYWVVNNKLTVLKEVKLLRMALPTDETEGIQSDSASPFGKWERRAMVIAIALTALFVSSFLSAQSVTIVNAGLSSDEFVTLSAQGQAEVVTTVDYRHHGPMPALHTTFHAPANHRIHWFDDQGRELKSETEAAGSHLRHTVALESPVMPGERIRLRKVQHQDQAATREENIWTFRTDTSYGGVRNNFALTVQLPDGAAILETTPNPTTDGSSPESGAPLLRFEDVRKANEPFVCSVRYRLPDHTTP